MKPSRAFLAAQENLLLSKNGSVMLGCMKTMTLASLLLFACGHHEVAKPASSEQPLVEQRAPIDMACDRLRACGLMTDSADDVKDCGSCASWLLRYFDSEGFDWQPYLSKIDETSCKAVDDFATYYGFFVCVDEQRSAWSRTHASGK